MSDTFLLPDLLKIIIDYVDGDIDVGLDNNVNINTICNNISSIYTLDYNPTSVVLLCPPLQTPDKVKVSWQIGDYANFPAIYKLHDLHETSPTLCNMIVNCPFYKEYPTNKLKALLL